VRGEGGNVLTYSDISSFFRLALHIDGLAQERAVQAAIGLACPYLVCLSARETGHAECIAQAESLIDLRSTQNSAPCQSRTPP